MSMAARLGLAREQILAFRRRAGDLDARLEPGAASLRRAARVGLQDSMPRAALLSLHARVAGVQPASWEDPALIQVWGPRFSAYVIAAEDRALFTLPRLPDDAKGRKFAQETADRLEAFLDGRTMTYGEAGRGLGINPNALRYAAPTGRVLIRWAGARLPTIWTVPAPDIDPAEARLALARRYLQTLGPTTAESFAKWAGIGRASVKAAFAALEPELLPVATPLGDAWILAEDEAMFRSPAAPAAPARLLPSGDAYWLHWGRDRELLIPDADRQAQLWTPRVWPGAVLVAGEIAGIWRRDGANLTVETWRSFSPSERAAVEAEAAALPLPEAHGPMRVSWSG